MTKLNIQNWSQLDFLINNFYEIVEYKRGRGIYGDRIILKRSRLAENIFNNSGRLFEFYYLDANAVKELPQTINEKIKFITRLVTSPENMNVICEFDNSNGVDPAEWALETKKELENVNSISFKLLNDILLKRYSLLGKNFIDKLKEHRKTQYFLASNENFNFITKEYVDEQLSKL